MAMPVDVLVAAIAIDIVLVELVIDIDISMVGWLAVQRMRRIAEAVVYTLLLHLPARNWRTGLPLRYGAGFAT
jgi:hypothetical protein